ncbi:MAG: hypothetical protein ACLPPF_11765 [Rhodomicrobium sp.]
MGEDNQWRQLGSIVNAVLLDTRAKAIRKGAVSQCAPSPVTRKIAPPAGGFTKQPMGNGFLRSEAPPALSPVQLELPFGIASTPGQTFGSARSPRGVRLM